MSISKVVLDLRERKDPQRQGVKAFQAEIEPQLSLVFIRIKMLYYPRLLGKVRA